MNLVIFTRHYPYGDGEEFLEDELRAAEGFFEHILIVSAARPPLAVTRYVPQNARLLPLLAKSTRAGLLMGRLSRALCPSVWRQLRRGVAQFGWGKAAPVAKRTLAEANYLRLLQKNRSAWAGEDAVFYSYWLDAAAAYLAMSRGRLHGPAVARAHGGDCFAGREFHPWRAQQFEGLDMIYPISAAGVADLTAQGCPAEKLLTARMGTEKPDGRLNPHPQGGEKHVVSCSHIIPLKRLDLLTDALALTADIPLRWTHFGEGRLKEQTAASAAGRVDLELKGYVPKARLLEYYAANSVDLFVNCSDAEGIPVSIMEALSYGIPVIARAVGGCGEIVEDGYNGVLLPARCSPEELSEAIRHILTLPPEDYTRLRANAYESWRRACSAGENYKVFWREIKKQKEKADGTEE